MPTKKVEWAKPKQLQENAEKNAKKKKEEEAKKPKKEVLRSVPIEELKVPASFPQEVAFYYGS